MKEVDKMSKISYTLLGRVIEESSFETSPGVTTFKARCYDYQKDYGYILTDDPIKFKKQLSVWRERL